MKQPHTPTWPRRKKIDLPKWSSAVKNLTAHTNLLTPLNCHLQVINVVTSKVFNY